MLHTTLGQLLVNRALPKELVDHDRVLDKQGMFDLLRRVALEHPDRYADVSKSLADIGRRVATETGGNSFSLAHMGKAKAGRKYQEYVQKNMKLILDNDKLTDQQRHEQIIRMVGGIQQKQMDEIMEESLAEKNPLGIMAQSGARGNAMNLASLRGSDWLYSDHRDHVVPLPVSHSYSQGLRPIEYWTGTYGARKGVMATKFATQDAGFLSKQLNQINHRLMVVDEDDPRDMTLRGLPVDTSDMDNEGSLLAHDAGPYKRHTVLSPKILKHLSQLGHDRILVRSPIIGGSPDGGVYARDAGVREFGTLPGKGSQIGLTAAQALSEPLQQGQLSAKHSGGVAGQEKAVSGFESVNQQIQVPSTFKGGAAHATQDGTVDRIEDAPAGGKFVYIDGTQHYVARGFDIHVKRGDKVEAGDRISEGAADPATTTEHKGIGEGRRVFSYALREAMQKAGMKANRRNIELLARGLINHVRLTDEFAGHLPEDVVPYSTVEHLYEPREDARTVPPIRAMGHYLEKPILHYTIGTKIRPSVLKELQHFGVKDVTVHHEPPPFQPEMIRGMMSLQHDPDPFTRMYGSGLKKGLQDSVHRGGTSDEAGTSFVPSLMRAVDFGHVGQVQQPKPGTLMPEEPEMPKRKTPPTTLSLPAPAASPSRFFGGASSLFKGGDDAAAKQEAAAILAKVGEQLGIVKEAQNGQPVQPQGMPALTPIHGATGSQYTQRAPMSATPGGMQPAHPQMSEHAMPHFTPPHSQAPAFQPASPHAPATTPGQVNPARMPQNNGAPGRGPMPGLFAHTDDPQQMAHFVEGNGFGGDVGRAMRLGSGLNMEAIYHLTHGGNRTDQQQSPGESAWEQMQQGNGQGAPQYAPGYSEQGSPGQTPEAPGTQATGSAGSFMRNWTPTTPWSGDQARPHFSMPGMTPGMAQNAHTAIGYGNLGAGGAQLGAYGAALGLNAAGHALPWAAGARLNPANNRLLRGAQRATGFGNVLGHAQTAADIGGTFVNVAAGQSHESGLEQANELNRIFGTMPRSWGEAAMRPLEAWGTIYNPGSNLNAATSMGAEGAMQAAGATPSQQSADTPVLQNTRLRQSASAQRTNASQQGAAHPLVAEFQPPNSADNPLAGRETRTDPRTELAAEPDSGLGDRTDTPSAAGDRQLMGLLHGDSSRGPNALAPWQSPQGFMASIFRPSIADTAEADRLRGVTQQRWRTWATPAINHLETRIGEEAHTLPENTRRVLQGLRTPEARQVELARIRSAMGVDQMATPQAATPGATPQQLEQYWAQIRPMLAEANMPQFVASNFTVDINGNQLSDAAKQALGAQLSALPVAERVRQAEAIMRVQPNVQAGMQRVTAPGGTDAPEVARSRQLAERLQALPEAERQPVMEAIGRSRLSQSDYQLMRILTMHEQLDAVRGRYQQIAGRAPNPAPGYHNLFSPAGVPRQ